MANGWVILLYSLVQRHYYLFYMFFITTHIFSSHIINESLFICSCLYIFRRESLARGSSYWPSFATWTPYEMMLLLMWSKFNSSEMLCINISPCVMVSNRWCLLYHLNSLHTVNGKHRTLLVTDGTVSGLSGDCLCCHMLLFWAIYLFCVCSFNVKDVLEYETNMFLPTVSLLLCCKMAC